MPLCLYLTAIETVSTVYLEHLGVRHKPQPLNHEEQKKKNKMHNHPRHTHNVANVQFVGNKINRFGTFKSWFGVIATHSLMYVFLFLGYYACFT